MLTHAQLNAIVEVLNEVGCPPENALAVAMRIANAIDRAKEPEQEEAT